MRVPPFTSAKVLGVTSIQYSFLFWIKCFKISAAIRPSTREETQLVWNFMQLLYLPTVKQLVNKKKLSKEDILKSTMAPKLSELATNTYSLPYKIQKTKFSVRMYIDLKCLGK